MGRSETDSEAVSSSPTVGRVLGYEFTVGDVDILVTAVGTFANGGEELSTPTAVAIWDSSQNLILNDVVPSGSAAFSVGEFRFLSLSSPLRLESNSLYIVGSRIEQGGTYRNYSGDAVISSLVTIGIGRIRTPTAEPYTTPIGQLFPSQNLGGSGVAAGPNLQITAIPEPNSVAALAALAAAMVQRRRR